MPKRKGSSRRWLQRHEADPYVQRARRAGYRSRAAYKLLELDERDQLLHRGQTVLDLGGAPGGWAQVAAERVGSAGCVIATDLLPIEPLPGVTVIQGDFEEPEIITAIESALPARGADLVLSDMAPNLSGMKAVDQPRAMALAELAADAALRFLKPGGNFVVKLFQGEDFDDFVREQRARFRKVAVRKPGASKGESREVYLVALDRLADGGAG